MATATTPNVGDLILVDSQPTNQYPVPPGLYVVINATAPYQVAPAGPDHNPTRSLGATVPQSRVIAVYRQD